MKGRLTTGDRIRHWNGGFDVSCVLCNDLMETKEHLSSDLGGIDERYMRIMRDTSMEKMKLFIIKYVFQASVYMVWRERNRRRHGEDASPIALPIKLIDKNMRNKLTLV